MTVAAVVDVGNFVFTDNALVGLQCGCHIRRQDAPRVQKLFEDSLACHCVKVRTPRAGFFAVILIVSVALGVFERVRFNFGVRHVHSLFKAVDEAHIGDVPDNFIARAFACFGFAGDGIEAADFTFVDFAGVQIGISARAVRELNQSANSDLKRRLALERDDISLTHCRSDGQLEGCNHARRAECGQCVAFLQFRIAVVNALQSRHERRCRFFAEHVDKAILNHVGLQVSLQRLACHLSCLLWRATLDNAAHFVIFFV